MAFKEYDDTERAEAMFALAVNRYDYAKTAQECGVSIKTLRRWDKDAPKKDIGGLLERAIERLLSAVPNDLRGDHWAITLGILMDKWLLMQGEPTSRTETIAREIEKLTPTERDAVIADARAIIERARSSRLAAGSTQSN